VETAVGRVASAVGRIDVLVTRAGIAHHRPVVDMTEAEWDRVIGVNLKGTPMARRDGREERRWRWQSGR
jgi:NAD(P)-dependent dehydrogenase (short-subunit alcohol dehydrogenase family)